MSTEMSTLETSCDVLTRMLPSRLVTSSFVSAVGEINPLKISLEEFQLKI